MRRRLLPLAALAALASTVALVSPVRAIAPPNQYEDYLRSDKYIVDQQTTLIWHRRPHLEGDAPKAVTLPAAKSACELAVPAGARLPTMKELLTLVDEDPVPQYQGKENVYPTIDISAFPETPVDRPYWTSTPAKDTGAMTVSFATGKTQPYVPTVELYVRCVRNVRVTPPP
jgi:hypothetical protein